MNPQCVFLVSSLPPPSDGRLQLTQLMRASRPESPCCRLRNSKGPGLLAGATLRLASSVFVHAAQKAVPSTRGCACVGHGVTRLLCGPPGHMRRAKATGKSLDTARCGNRPATCTHTPDRTSGPHQQAARPTAQPSGMRTHVRAATEHGVITCSPHTERASNHDDVKRATRHGSRALHFPRWRGTRASTFSDGYGRTLSLLPTPPTWGGVAHLETPPLPCGR